MKKKFKFFLSPRTWLTILTAACFLLIGITFFTDKLTVPLQKITSTIIVPLQKGVNGIGLWLTEKKDLFQTVESLQKENDELKEEVRIIYKQIKKESLLKELATELISKGIGEKEVESIINSNIKFDDEVIEKERKKLAKKK